MTDLALTNRTLIKLALVVLSSALWVAPAHAQIADTTFTIPSDVTIHDYGWTQIQDIAEIREFILDALTTLILVAILALHPKANAIRKNATERQVRTSILIFGLIGMLIGFLVDHHGYLIGFVVFGIGGLFRFRLETSSLMDSGILILTTLVGLAVGLNLPVMALLSTLAGWLVIWFASIRKTAALELRFEDDASMARGLEPARKLLESHGYEVLSVGKEGQKPSLDLVFSYSGDEILVQMPTVIEELTNKGHHIKGWSVS